MTWILRVLMNMGNDKLLPLPDFAFDSEEAAREIVDMFTLSNTPAERREDDAGRVYVTLIKVT